MVQHPPCQRLLLSLKSNISRILTLTAFSVDSDCLRLVLNTAEQDGTSNLEGLEGKDEEEVNAKGRGDPFVKTRSVLYKYLPSPQASKIHNCMQKLT